MHQANKKNNKQSKNKVEIIAERFDSIRELVETDFVNCSDAPEYYKYYDRYREPHFDWYQRTVDANTAKRAELRDQYYLRMTELKQK